MVMSSAADNGAICEVPMTVVAAEGNYMFNACDLQWDRIADLGAGGSGALGSLSSGDGRLAASVGRVRSVDYTRGYHVFSSYLLCSFNMY